MSQENVEAMRRLAELFLRGDAAFLDMIDPAVEWDISTHPLPDVPNRGRGREAFLTQVLATYSSGWNDYSAEVKEASEAGEDVLLVIHEKATMGDTGVPLERDLAELWTIREGKAVFMRVFRTREAALKAAGLSE